MTKTLAACALLALSIPAFLALGLGAVLLSLSSEITGGVAAPADASSVRAGISAGSGSGIPAGMLALYIRGEAACPGLSWTVLAAIGTVESSNGTSDAAGVHSGANFAGAEGPMQFEPATFAAYDEPVPPGGANPPSPYDPTDAVFAAARMLCANGAARPGGLGAAVFAYNHSVAYVDEVVTFASSYAQRGAGG